MPFIKVETNVTVPDESGCLRKLSALAAELLGKPESYVLAELESGKRLLFGGSADPAAFVTLDSIGLPETRTPELSAALCGFLNRELGIPADRVYIAFGDIERHLFGWDGGTF
ncbi:macrophage migration inhibitory factor family protein [Pseudodesulfovibrio mercurii]|uniref:L-dopachrome isomerase n=1 Tax=Pseudodesulfovibrio mercurii TaxID=641491 RepID=F0JI15_9BACT|nr:phenylpyruvate tautomerase MIF-related protein [Pseudodesulfovibrio mercurii]EGB14145.1 macrophage migration inhibitory factor family protein [Pseudodesulfovibrio mercurii]